MEQVVQHRHVRRARKPERLQADALELVGYVVLDLDSPAGKLDAHGTLPSPPSGSPREDAQVDREELENGRRGSLGWCLVRNAATGRLVTAAHGLGDCESKRTQKIRRSK